MVGECSKYCKERLGCYECLGLKFNEYQWRLHRIYTLHRQQKTKPLNYNNYYTLSIPPAIGATQIFLSIDLSNNSVITLFWLNLPNLISLGLIAHAWHWVCCGCT